MRCTRLLPAWLWLGLFALGAPAGISAQDTIAATSKRPADAASFCCAVVRVDTRSGLVTARETASGYTFQFRVPNRRLLAGIKVGLKIWADFTAEKVWVSLSGEVKPEQPCCDIIPTPSPSSSPAARAGASLHGIKSAEVWSP